MSTKKTVESPCKTCEYAETCNKLKGCYRWREWFSLSWTGVRKMYRVRDFGEILRDEMFARHLTYSKVHSMTGVAVSTLANIVNYGTEPSYTVLIRICKGLKLSADYMLGITQENEWKGN